MLKKGIYEQIIDQQIEQLIKESEQHELICHRKEIDDAELPQLLANYLARVVQQKLEEVENETIQVKVINKLLSEVDSQQGEQITEPAQLLGEVISYKKQLLKQQTHSLTIRPLSGFRVSNLFTGGSSSLSLGEEIRREIASADEICFLVSFLKLSGVRIFLNELDTFCQQAGKRLRIITTTYCGATQGKAIEQLAALPNTEIRISYQTEIERLHAKSYIFVRNSGMHTAYIGSSNLSKSAQTDGLEWNLRVTSVENPHIIKSALATFDIYWNSHNFEDFSIGGIKKFNAEVNRNRMGKSPELNTYNHYTLLPHQKQILDKLQVERTEYCNTKNLIVAATGTGKTVISAFDYQAFRRIHPRSRILFTAHREEILRQSLNTYRSVLCDTNFGTLWVGNEIPQEESEYDYLFVSIAMLNARFETFFGQLGNRFYDYIVIDEAHHSQAESYRKLFDYFKPQLLIGLTATPERMDGRDLRPDFGGRISAEIRLPQALQAGLLTPFHYFCITDSTDLSDDSLWSGAKYNVEKLSQKLCSKERAAQIVKALHKYIADEYSCRALCFCATKQHAHFMATQLQQYGFNAQSLTSDTPSEKRKELAQQLREGIIHYLCVVDIFNEGIDIPEVDTVLFLRPTESLTIFLQQLGRGLRLSAGKTELTVLDFVAQANKKYDFANRFRALTLHPEKSIGKQVKEGFTLLPNGCSIVMEQKARKYILDNIQGAIYNQRRLIRELNGYQEIPTLSLFIENNGQDIRLIYKKNGCWSALKRAAGRITYTEDAVTKRLEKGMGNLVHHNTASFLHFVEGFVNGNKAYLEASNHSYALMLYYALFQDKVTISGFETIYHALESIHKENYSCFKQELSELTNYLLAHLEVRTFFLGDAILPKLELYGCYTREEVFTLAGRQTAEFRMQGSPTGVFNLEEKNLILLFVTLNKSEKEFSPSTQYNDYVINEELFHWQSQNRDAHHNRGGQKYTEQQQTDKQILLFVREEKKDAFENTCAFHCFGLVDYLSSQGDFPMNVTWKLQKPVMAKYLKAI